MKKLILATFAAALTSFALTATAQAENVMAELSGVDNQLKSIQLLENGLIKATKLDNKSEFLQLSEINTRKLLAMVQELSSAEIISTHTPIICLMAMNFVMQNLSVADLNTGELKLVLSPETCAVGGHTFPKEQYLLQTARDLKSQMILLAHQAVNE